MNTSGHGYAAGWRDGFQAATDFFTGKGMNFEEGKKEMDKWDEWFYQRMKEAGVIE